VAKQQNWRRSTPLQSKLRQIETMPRLQLLEIHEQPWCPEAIRRGAMDCLKVVATVGAQYRNVLSLLQEALVATNNNQIIDLCSGGGGPWPNLYRRLQPINGQPARIILTDLYPDGRTFEQIEFASAGVVAGAPLPVNATAVPVELEGFRTLFTAFHHFEPDRARAILQDAVQKQQGIAIFEQTRRTPLAIIMMLLLPWIAFLVVPFIRPFRLSRLLWTYLLPAIPLVLCVDGVVSCLRTYSEQELRAMVDSIVSDYVWQIGRTSSPLSPIGIGYLIGYPQS
jgi:hypothetical protein